MTGAATGSPVDGFDRLSPALQHRIVNDLGFRELRPVQDLTIGPVLDGRNCVVLAPTAGGKTEAAFFPLLSRMDTEDWRPVSVVYVSPIRALLNNQEPRLARYASLIGRRAALWHGDTTQAERRRFIAEPADILLTTPESLEVMLMSRRVPARRLFGGLRAVVVDEIHAFVGDDRGGHLAAVLERLSRFCGRDLQRIGLSATVGNPETILDWLSCSSEREGAVIDPPRPPTEPDVRIDYVGTLENAARVIDGLHRGEKRLVFVDSRRGVEALGKALRAHGTEAHVLHSSLSADERQLAERAFGEGSNCVVVATSALELGIDIGDLDRVLQVDAPSKVASFLQRMGRTGRRPGARANCLFLATTDQALLQAAAVVRLRAEGFVEPVRPVVRAAHLLAHQIMALSVQEEGGVPESDWWGWVCRATPFVELDARDRAALVDHMVAEGILARSAGRLALAPRGEKLYGRRNFMELYAVFSTPRVLQVVWGTKELGAIEADFASQFDLGDLAFTLGARAWRAVHVDWSRARIEVQPALDGVHPRWRGSPILLEREICQAVRAVLVGTDEPSEWTRRAVGRIAELRAEHDFLDEDGDGLVDEHDGVTLWNFAGGRINNLLAKVLEQQLGQRVMTSNLNLRFRDDAGTSIARVRAALADLAEAGRPDFDDALAHADSCVRARLSKFQPCLPEALEQELLARIVTRWTTGQADPAG